MKIHLFGYVTIDRSDCIAQLSTIKEDEIKIGKCYITEEPTNILNLVNRILLNSKYDNEIEDDDSEFEPDYDYTIPDVEVSLYTSDEEKSLEEVQTGFLENLLGIGTVEGKATPYGYSVWTIIGLELNRFHLVNKENGGEHDLNQILSQYEGKYVHLIFNLINVPIPSKEKFDKLPMWYDELFEIMED